jgi:hypothetical protein
LQDKSLQGFLYAPKIGRISCATPAQRHKGFFQPALPSYRPGRMAIRPLVGGYPFVEIPPPDSA